MSVRRPRAVNAILSALGVLVVLHVVYLLLAGAPSKVVTDVLYTLVEGVATVLCVMRAVTVRRDRLGWGLLAGYLVLWTVGDLGWTVHFNAVTNPPFPNWTDAAYVSSYGLAFTGQALLLRGHLGRIRVSLLMDGLVAGLAAGSICAALFFGAIVSATSGPTATVGVTLAYPVLDMVLLCIVGVAFGLAGWRPSRVWWTLGVATIVNAVGDAIYCYQEALGSYTVHGWINLTWPLAMAGMAWAAWQPVERRAAVRSGETTVAAPAIATLVALGILVWDHSHAVPLLADVLAASALLAVAVRALLTHRENAALLQHSRSEALTDGLTGLGNRRQLMADIERVLGHATEQRPSTLMFFDLDGFKAYNDAFGHSAGDVLLTRLGGHLAAAMGDDGEAYRLGGDEFCVLIDSDGRRAERVLHRAGQALSARGEGFAIGASVGSVTLPIDAGTPNVALQVADERMYAQKGNRRSSAKRQARDLLLQILQERDPQLNDHTSDVATLAVAVGHELSLDRQLLEDLARGAELHDVGKIAVPEAILNKPGPLDDDEWAVMHQHTVIGERILAAAPALRSAAPLVRSSHERWDGTGYPDGLAGRAIPLGARIIATCDAYDAMRQHRTYAAATTESDAVKELQRCAGTQFDPDVVQALTTVLLAKTSIALRVA